MSPAASQLQPSKHPTLALYRLLLRWVTPGPDMANTIETDEKILASRTPIDDKAARLTITRSVSILAQVPPQPLSDCRPSLQ